MAGTNMAGTNMAGTNTSGAMQRNFDVVIIGGGVVGSSIAYFLGANPDFKGSVAVVEREPHYERASSSLSTSAIRQQFGTPPNIGMSAFSIDFLRDAKNRLSTDDAPAEISLREQGYLILGAPEHVTAFEERHAVQRACGCATQLLSPNEMKSRFPWLNVDGVGIGAYGPEKEGWFDGPGLMQAYKRKARALGATYIAAEVVGLEQSDPGKIDAVTLNNGEKLGAGTVVNAAGCWSGQIARMAGASLPVVPRKRCIFVFDSPEKIPHAPFVFDPGGALFRPEGHLYICGIDPLTENADDDFSMEVDYDLFDEIIWPALANRVPGFEQLKMLRAWAGLYEYNLFDHSGIIGRHPDFKNFVLSTGFSGHGMMHSPATGCSTSELIVYGESRSLDIGAFGFERIAENRPIVEHVY